MQYSVGYLLDGRYRLIKLIGSGSFGEVWVTRDCETDLDVAVKIYVSLDMQGLEDFKKEFQLSFNFNHTNLLHANYLGVNVEDNRPYLVMPLCPDGSVGKFSGNMTETELWRFVRDVSSGLAYLHGQVPPVIHQDIKPDNVLILPSGEYVITDFGISKRLKNSMRQSSSQMNSAGAVAYMGPERFSSHYQAVKASDIWSLGATIFELATGDLPFCGLGGGFQRKGADMPEMPDTFSKDFRDVVLSCLALETWDRPTAAQLAEYARLKVKGEPAVISWNHAVAEPAVDNKRNNRSPEDFRHYSDADKPSSNPYRPVERKSGEKVSAPVALWVIVSLLGLVSGLLLNYFINFR